MKRQRILYHPANVFEIVKTVGLALPGVVVATKYDYYLTDYYQRYPLLLVRLSSIDRDALRDVLTVSWRLTSAKGRRPR